MDQERLKKLLDTRQGIVFNAEKALVGDSGRTVGSSVVSEAEFLSYCKEFGYVAEGSEESKSVPVAKVLQKSRIKRFVGSNEKSDRHGDVVRVEGWDTKDYKANPVFLLSHDSSQMPIGKALRVWKGNDPADNSQALMFDIYFPPESVSADAEKVFKLYEAGILQGVSVGFKPTDAYWPQNDDERKKLGLGPNGVEFRAQTLLELSAVSIPANASALIVENSLQAAMCKSLGLKAELKPVSDAQRIESLEKSMLDLLSMVKPLVEKASKEPPAKPAGPIAPVEGGDKTPKGAACTCDKCGNEHTVPKKSLYKTLLDDFGTKISHAAPAEKVDFSQVADSFAKAFKTPVKETP